MKNLLIIIFTLSIFNLNAQCKYGQTKFDEIVNKYQSQLKALEYESNKIKEEAPDPNGLEAISGTTFEVKMKRQDFSFDLISITMKDKEISFHIPKITMKLRSMKYKIPYTKMVIKKIGQYPEVHGLTIKWKDIKTSVPEVHSRIEEIKTKIPEISYERTSFITAIPEFKKERQNISIDLPSVVFREISAEVNKVKGKADDIKEKTNKIVKLQKEELLLAMNQNFNCQRESLMNKRENINSEFDSIIQEIENNISNLKAHGLNPEKVPSEDGTEINLVALKNDLLEKKNMAFKQIDNTIDQLSAEERKVIEEFVR